MPVTSNVSRVHPFQVLLTPATTGLRRDSKAQAEPLRAVSIERVGRRLGRLPAHEMADLDRAIRLHLAL